MGARRRTLFVAPVLLNKSVRSRIARQLNTVENLRAPRRDIFPAHKGTVRHRAHQQQTD